MKRTLPFLVAVSLCQTASAQLEQGLIAYWPLDRTSLDQTTTSDRINSADLSLVNMSAANLVAGQRYLAMTFNGTSQLLARDVGAAPTPGLPLYSSNSAFTICMWVRGTAASQPGGERRVFSESSLTNNTPLYNICTDNTTPRTGVMDVFIRMNTGGGGSNVNHIKSDLNSTQPFDGQWRHIAVTDNNGAVQIYVDGVLNPVAINYTRGTLTSNILSLGGLRRGGTTGDSLWYNGAIDDVAIWSRILSAAEIQTVMTTGVSAPPDLIPSLPPPYLQGDRIKFTALAYGAGPFTFQWKKDNVDILNETNQTLVLPALGAADIASYSVAVNGVNSPTIPVTFTADPAPNPSNSIVSWWPGNEIIDTQLPAITPDPWGAHVLNCVGMDSTSVTPGMFGNALQFDALSSRIAVRNDGFPISTNPDFTIAMWVKGVGIGQSDLRVFSEGSNTTNTPIFTLGTSSNTSSSLRVLVRTDANVAVVNGHTTSAVFDDTWHHIAWSEKNGTVRFYVDGVLDETLFRYNRASNVLTLNQTSLGGVQRAAASNLFTGAIDDAAVWNRALTWSEIQSIKTNGVPAPVIAVPPQVTVHPISRVTYQDRSVTFSIQATGTGPLSYQWHKGLDPVQDATLPDLVLNPTAVSQSGSYTCKVTNTAGNATSDPAQLTVNPITGLGTGLINSWALESASPSAVDSVSGHDLAPSAQFNNSFQGAIIGNGVLFDGTEDLLVHTRTGNGQDTPLSTRPEFSVAFWVNGSPSEADPGIRDRRVFSEQSTTNTTPMFNLCTENSATAPSSLLTIFIRPDTGAGVDHAHSLVPVFDNTWHHVVYTDRNGTYVLYVDGVQDVLGTYTRRPTTLTNVSIGGIQRATPGNWFPGLVDQVQTWERGLDAPEADILYQIGRGTALNVTAVEPIAGNKIRLTIHTIFGANAVYSVQESSNLATGPWTNVAGAVLTPVVDNTFTAEFTAGPPGVHYYRVLTPW